jgi:ribosomal protein S27E
MIQKFSCPSCAAELVFYSLASVYVSCPACRSLVVRHGTDLELMGKVSDVLDDLTIIQPRTKGRFQDRAFDVLGRLRVAWADGFWNEWCVDLGGKICWLSEAQGHFVFYDRVEPVTTAPKLPLTAGAQVSAPNGDLYSVTDVRNARIVGLEGEVPVKVELGAPYTSIDVQKNNEQVGTLDIKSHSTNFFYGKVQNVKELNLEYLRQIDGW